MDVLAVKFKREKFIVYEATNGIEGLDVVKKKKPDLILLDIIMPVMDGLSMLNLLKSDDWGKDIPVIILTNLSDAEKISQATENGVYVFLIKSDWHIDDVVRNVRKKLGEK